MEVVHPRCCGIDVHQASLAVCVSIKEGGKSEKYKLRCGTTTAELLRANPAQVQGLRGRKTDLKDGERIADYLQHGLLQGSFVPPRPIQELRDLTRSRTSLKQEQVRIGNRIRKVLEDANVKLSSVMSDVMGVSGQAMLRAMVRGESDPDGLPGLARKRLRGKIPVLRQAAIGTLNEHHRFLLEQWLAHWDELKERIAKFDQRIEEQMRPFAEAVETWTSLPGIDRIT